MNILIIENLIMLYKKKYSLDKFNFCIYEYFSYKNKSISDISFNCGLGPQNI